MNLKELRERVLRGKYRIPFYMSTDCETLLKKFLVLNPAKRASLETIMKDKWMNVGYEDDELKPFVEPEQLIIDPVRVNLLTNLGYTKEEIEESLKNRKYDDIMANYLLLYKKPSDNEQSDSRSSSSLSLRGLRPSLDAVPNITVNTSVGNTGNTGQSPAHNKVQRSISATTKPRRFSHGGHGTAVVNNTAISGNQQTINSGVTGDATVITNNQASLGNENLMHNKKENQSQNGNSQQQNSSTNNPSSNTTTNHNSTHNKSSNINNQQQQTNKDNPFDSWVKYCKTGAGIYANNTGSMNNSNTNPTNNQLNNNQSSATVPHHSHQQYANKQQSQEVGSLRQKLKHRRLFNLIEKPSTEKTNLVNNSNNSSTNSNNLPSNGNTPFKKLDLSSADNDTISTNTSNGDTHLQR